ncbi:MAG: hypothetical protein Q9225_004726 [Loekoesia sp. 1 TL-2023]
MVIIALCFGAHMLFCEAFLDDGDNELLGPAEAEVRDPRRRQGGGYPFMEHAWEQARPKGWGPYLVGLEVAIPR